MSAPNPGTLRFKEIAASPAAPPVGYAIVYVKTDNVVYLKDSNGTEIPLGSSSAITELTGDVSALGPASAVATVNFVGGSSAALINAAELLANAATNLNTASAIVKRDGSGNFSAGSITANLIGNASGSAASFTGSLAGDVTGTQGATVISSSTVISKLLTGFVIGPNTAISSTDTVLQAFQKLQGQVGATAGAAITQLTGDVQAIGPGSVSSVVIQVGGALAADIALAVAAYQAATNLNTPSTLVKRDGSGNILITQVNGVAPEAHASRHLPSGADSLSTAAPIANLSTATTNIVGTANSFSRSDHGHAIDTGLPSSQTTDQSNTTGVSSSLARADHIHNIATDVAVGLDADSSDAQGSSTKFARSDHTHSLATGSAVSQTPDQSNGPGTSPNLARADHIHNIATDDPIQVDADGNNDEGIAASFARSDHKHDISTDIPVSQTPDQSNAAGTSVSLARADHVHNIPADAPTTTLSPATTNAEGTGASFARSDHAHAVATSLVGDITTIQPDDSASAGVVNKFARGDHRHAIAAAAAVAQTPDQANAEGSSTSFARADHVHSIETDQPSTLTPNQGNIQGTAASFARSDHIHEVPTAAPVTQSPDQSNADGSAATFSKSDHIHEIQSAAPINDLTADTMNDRGTAVTFALSDHSHAIDTGTPISVLPDEANDIGSNARLAKSDHKHNAPTAAPIANLTPASTNAQGAAATFSRSDHSHAITSAAPVAQIPDQANAAGSAASFAKSDHVHNIPTAIPVQIGTSNFAGAASTFSLSDHVHSHGNLPGGSLHAAASGSAAGFMSAADFTKLAASTSLNTASAIVMRDGSGNFSAGTITANLIGNVTGNVSGTAATFTGNLTGDVTSVGMATTIAANVVSNSKFRQSVALSVVGNSTNTTADVADISAGTDGFILRRSGTTLDFGTILNNSIDSAAAIDFSKLAAMSTGQILLGNAGIPTATAIGGDATIGATGILTIAIGAITDTKASLATKPACTVVATSNQTLSGIPTVDGVGLADGSIVLASAQTTGSENGPWVVHTGAWTRPTWFPNGGTSQAFQFITALIRLGTAYQGTTWRMTTSGAVTIGTTSTTWVVTPLAINSNTVTGTLPAAQLPAFTGDATSSAGSSALTIASHAVSNSKFRQSVALSVVGNSTNGTADVADITAGTDNHVLRRSGTSIGFGTLPNASLANSTIGLTLGTSGSTANVSGSPASLGGSLTLNLPNKNRTAGISVDGQGAVIQIGVRGFIKVPFTGTITSWTIISRESGSAVFDIWKSTSLPTIANTITAAAKPTLTSSTVATSSTLTGWTTSVTAGDIIGFNVDSASTTTWMELQLTISEAI